MHAFADYTISYQQSKIAFIIFFLSKLGVVGDLTRTHQDLVIGSKSQPEAPSM